MLAILPWEHYESIVETLEILADKDMMKAFRKGVEDIKKGRTYTTEELKKELLLPAGVASRLIIDRIDKFSTDEAGVERRQMVRT